MVEIIYAFVNLVLQEQQIHWSDDKLKLIECKCIIHSSYQLFHFRQELSQHPQQREINENKGATNLNKQKQLHMILLYHLKKVKIIVTSN